jgi:hypothetical protein
MTTPKDFKNIWRDHVVYIDLAQDRVQLASSAVLNQGSYLNLMTLIHHLRCTKQTFRENGHGVFGVFSYTRILH